MSLKLSALAPRLAVAGVTAEQALQLAGEIVSLVGVVEQVYDGLKGDVKFQAVMSALDQVVAQMGLADKLAAIKKAAGPLVNLVVAVLNGASLWTQLFASIASAFSKSTPPPPQTLSATVQPA